MTRKTGEPKTAIRESAPLWRKNGMINAIKKGFRPTAKSGNVGTLIAIYKAWQAWCEPVTTEENRDDNETEN